MPGGQLGHHLLALRRHLGLEVWTVFPASLCHFLLLLTATAALSLGAGLSLSYMSEFPGPPHVLLVGPAGVGKTFLAQALGFSAIRASHTVRFLHADDFFRAMAQARVDNSVDRTSRSFLSPDLLILDDLGLHRLTAQQSADLYELIIGRHRVSRFVITSNRAVEEWLSLFDDPILGNSALDRLANASFRIVIEGASYKEKLSPHRKLLGDRGGD